MSIAQGANTVRKCRHRVIFLGQRPQLEKQGQRAVIAVGVDASGPPSRLRARPPHRRCLTVARSSLTRRSRSLPPLGLAPRPWRPRAWLRISAARVRRSATVRRPAAASPAAAVAASRTLASHLAPLHAGRPQTRRHSNSTLLSSPEWPPPYRADLVASDSPAPSPCEGRLGGRLHQVADRWRTNRRTP